MEAHTSHSLYSKASLATRTQSLHSLQEPKPPAPAPPAPSLPPPNTAEVYEEREERGVWRTKSFSQLDSEAVSLTYSEFPHPPRHPRPPPPLPPPSSVVSPWSDLRSVSVDQQDSGLYRTISRATLIDQETGSVYQLLENRQPLLLSQQARNSREHRPTRQINNQASIDLGMLQQVTVTYSHLSPHIRLNCRPEVSCSV